MANGRIYRAGLSEVVIELGRIYRAGLTGAAASVPHGRIYRSGLTGTASVVLNPLTPVTAEPEAVVQFTATLTGGGSVDSWTWRQISGPTISFTGTGGTRSFRAPSAMPTGTTVTIGVRATAGGTTSPEQTVTVTVLPQLAWSYQAGAWVGRRQPVTV